MTARRSTTFDFNDLPLYRYVRGSRDGYDTIDYIVDTQTKQTVVYLDSRDSYADIMREIAQHQRYLKKQEQQ